MVNVSAVIDRSIDALEKDRTISERANDLELVSFVLCPRSSSPLTLGGDHFDPRGASDYSELSHDRPNNRKLTIHSAGYASLVTPRRA